jgi:hypothetical protein
VLGNAFSGTAVKVASRPLADIRILICTPVPPSRPGKDAATGKWYTPRVAMMDGPECR